MRALAALRQGLLRHRHAVRGLGRPLALAATVLAALIGEAGATTNPCLVEAPCEVEGGTYALALPKGWNGERPLPALVFFHGWGASAAAALNQPSLRAALDARGWLLIAPNGARPPGRKQTSWAHQGSPSQARDDVAFVHAVLDDVARRLPVDAGRVFVGGFSQGASMAWHLACLDEQPYAGFVAVSGAFWEPMPEACPAPPRRLIHVHGFMDGVVPLEGRPIGDRWQQSDVFEGLALLRRAWSCPTMPKERVIAATMRCRAWTGCARGAGLKLCLHDGGHQAPEGWAGEALGWLDPTAPSAARSLGGAAPAR